MKAIEFRYRKLSGIMKISNLVCIIFRKTPIYIQKQLIWKSRLFLSKNLQKHLHFKKI